MSRQKVKASIIKNNLLPYKCSECNITEWNGKPISLHLDHINGINDDNRLDNLRFLCPNCHSQTDTYCGANSKRYSAKNKKVSDEILLEAIRTNINPAKALQSVRLSGAANYKRVYRLAEIHQITHMFPTEKKPLLEKHCPSCKNLFTPIVKKQKFCSKSCGRSVHTNPITTEELYEAWLANQKNYSATARQIGMSGSGIKKRFGERGWI